MRGCEIAPIDSTTIIFFNAGVTVKQEVYQYYDSVSQIEPRAEIVQIIVKSKMVTLPVLVEYREKNRELTHGNCLQERLNSMFNLKIVLEIP